MDNYVEKILKSKQFKEAKEQLWEERWVAYQWNCCDYGLGVELTKAAFEPSDSAVLESMGIQYKYPAHGEGWFIIHV